MQSVIVRFMTADDTNLWNYKNLMERINIKVKQDLRYLANWLNSNKICLNVNKAEVLLFKSSRKFTDILFKLKRYGKSLYPTYQLSEISWYKNWWKP